MSWLQRAKDAAKKAYEYALDDDDEPTAYGELGAWPDSCMPRTRFGTGRRHSRTHTVSQQPRSQGVSCRFTMSGVVDDEEWKPHLGVHGALAEELERCAYSQSGCWSRAGSLSSSSQGGNGIWLASLTSTTVPTGWADTAVENDSPLVEPTEGAALGLESPSVDGEEEKHEETAAASGGGGGAASGGGSKYAVYAKAARVLVGRAATVGKEVRH
jgi:hypothetical protein